MDFDASNFGGGKTGGTCLKEMQTIDAAGIFLNTLKAFDKESREDAGFSGEIFSAENEESFLPSLEYILVFSTYIKERMDDIFNALNVPLEPPMEIKCDNRGRIFLSGDRNDLKMLSKALNADRETADGLRTLLSIADQTYQLLEHLDTDDSFPEFAEDTGKVVYIYGDGFLSLYREDSC